MALSGRTIARLSKPFEGGSGPTHASIDRVWLSADAEQYLPQEGNKAERVRGGLMALRDGARSPAGQPMPPDHEKLARVAEELALMLVSRGERDEDDLAEALASPTHSVNSPNEDAVSGSTSMHSLNSVRRPKGVASPVSMFIGSSVEGLPVARALQAELEFDVESTIWSQGVFGLGDGTLEALVARAPTFDFAALVLTPDDLLMRREWAGNAPRDNVVFEAGLFMGALGRRRVFMVSCRDDDLALPSDFAGITMAQYNRRSDGNLRAAVGPVATNILTAIKAALSAPEEHSGSADPRSTETAQEHGKREIAATDSSIDALERIEPESAPKPDPQDDLYELLNAIDQLTPLLQAQSGPLRGDLARLYAVIMSRVKVARPANVFVSSLTIPQETAMSGIYKTTAAEAVAGLSMMRSALLSAS